MFFIAELKRRNVVKVASVYLVTAWLILQIIAVVSPYLSLPSVFGTVVTVALIIGFPFVCIFAWAFELTPEGIRATREVSEEESIARQTGHKINHVLVALIVVLVVYVAVDKLWLSSSPAIVKAIEVVEAEEEQKVKVLAVLPFLNLSTEPDQEIFVDGLTEELLNTLVRIPELKVLGRTSSFAYKGVQKDLKVIAKELGADYVIEGSVRKSQQNLRITVQLIDAATGAHLFSDNFDRKLENVFALQEDVSDQVAAALKLNVVHQNDRYATALNQLNYVEVEQLVRARALTHKLTTDSINQAKHILDPLLAKYPDISAILGLSAYVATMEVSMTENVSLNEAETIALAEAALELDPLNRDALYTLAVTYDDYSQLTDKALRIYQKAIRVYPYDFYFIHAYFTNLIVKKTPCVELDGFYNSLELEGLEDKYKNRLRYFTLACSAPEDAERYKSTVTTENVERYMEYVDPMQTYKSVEKRYRENPNQRNAFWYYYLLQVLGATNDSKAVLDDIDLSSHGYWATYTYTASYFTDIELPEKNWGELWQALAQNNYFAIYIDDALALFDMAQKQEKLAQFRQHLAGLTPPDVSIEQLYNLYSYVEILYKLGEHQKAISIANEALRLLEEYKHLYPREYVFYGLSKYEFALNLTTRRFDTAQRILNNYPDRSEFAWRHLEPTRYLYRDIADQPVVQQLLSSIEQERTKLREELSLH
ncbi:hypothetical protein [Alteromonas gilva]|uniref:FlgO domain-containing protein n=1 Tax=Alteromonas gilva TaxID=2987522 RepID=A0ABT5KYG5_9ALTE|nr:hypothetical protein [Alteromonas gilva]MDC8829251.1 hypothetical protein [Alteromonas gilva]